MNANNNMHISNGVTMGSNELDSEGTQKSKDLDRNRNLSVRRNAASMIIPEGGH